MFLKANLGYLSQIALKNMQLLILIKVFSILTNQVISLRKWNKLTANQI